MHVSKALLEQGHHVYGIDNINDYYSVTLKQDRLNELISTYSQFQFQKMDITNLNAIYSLFKNEQFDYVIHLAAQAGVRYGLISPHSYVNSNLVGMMNILEACRHFTPKHLVFASSSSVYGANDVYPYNEKAGTDHPLSLYAATKKSNEVMAHSYAHLFKIPISGLRFFTVYGPWGRPDMAPMIFTKAITEDKEISIFNHGKMQRDFTYIDDVVEGITRIALLPPKEREWVAENTGGPNATKAPFQVLNIGNSNPIELIEFIQTLESCLGKKAKKKFMDMQPGDVLKTYSDSEKLFALTGYRPKTSLQEGIRKFVDWYQEYQNLGPRMSINGNLLV